MAPQVDSSNAVQDGAESNCLSAQVNYSLSAMHPGPGRTLKKVKDAANPIDSNRAERLVELKHDEYVRACRCYRCLYYLLRLSAGLSAALLPFVVTLPTYATTLSIVIVVTTVVDMVFNPKDRWKLYSRTADLLTMERLKQSGEYQGYEHLLSLLVTTEAAKLEDLVTLEQVAKKIQATGHN